MRRDLALPLLAAATLGVATVALVRRHRKSPKELMRRYFRAWEDRDPDALEDLLSKDYCGHVHTLSGQEERNARRLRGLVDSHAQAFDWTEYDVEDVFEDGDRAAARVSVRAGHRETGRDGEMNGLVIMRFDKGRIAEEWSSWDYLGLAEQLGLSQG